MRKNLFLFATLLISIAISVHAQWRPAGDKIKTQWASQIKVNDVLPEYPRPTMERPDWQNLNGLWEYAICPVEQNEPKSYAGKILVPFAIESSLSGVQKTLDTENELWYKRTFSIPSTWEKKQILLHFGAVDWKTEVFVNDVKVGEHVGGYTPFSFNITPHLTSGEQKLVVKVWDPTDDGIQSRGKQTNRPGGITYSAVSGIWQTVWLEPVNEKYISYIKTTPNIDQGKLLVEVETQGTNSSDLLELNLKDGDKIIYSSKATIAKKIEVAIPNAKLWSPESPFLYDLDVKLYDGENQSDEVSSYAAMRKVSIRVDEGGMPRIQLNNKDRFLFGVLDQGWWPDGLYTAPTDEALVYDIQKVKDLGYNIIRKHVKVEPARWYAHCDRMGMIVWQDMPNGSGFQNKFWRRGYPQQELSFEDAANYRNEWKDIIHTLYSHPSIIAWFPYNEGWDKWNNLFPGMIYGWIKDSDPSRLINVGENTQMGDVLEIMAYPAPQSVPALNHKLSKPVVINGFGGISYPKQGHLWQDNRNWGYMPFQNSKEATNEYLKYCEIIKLQIETVYSAAIYTQLTDIESEINGLMTYDRKMNKFDEDRIRKVNQEICNSLNVSISPGVR